VHSESQRPEPTTSDLWGSSAWWWTAAAPFLDRPAVTYTVESDSLWMLELGEGSERERGDSTWTRTAPRRRSTSSKASWNSLAVVGRVPEYCERA